MPFGDTLARLLGTTPGVGARPAPVRAGAVTLTRASAFVAPSLGVGPPLAPVDFAAMWGWVDRDAAMSLPTIQRGRDLIVSAVSALPFTRWRDDLSAPDAPPIRIADAGWFDRPDPDKTRQWLLAFTGDDLLFYGVAHWRITAHYDDGYPRTFRRVIPGGLDMRDDHAMVSDPSYNAGQPERVELSDLVQFLAPLEGMLTNGGRPISIALSLDAAAARFAETEVPSGWLQERDGGEDMTGAELGELAAGFTAARRANTTAALNKWVEYHEAGYDPSTMQIVEGRTYQALELSRLANIPGYMTGAPAGTGMTYLNAAQAKSDLIDFAAAPVIACIEQTLSGPNVTPRGQHVRMDLTAWLRNPFNPTDDPNAPPPPEPEQLELPL